MRLKEKMMVMVSGSRSGPFCSRIELSIPFLFAASPAQTYGEGSNSRTEKCTEKNWLACAGFYIYTKRNYSRDRISLPTLI